jgi:hypothetical protein
MLSAHFEQIMSSAYWHVQLQAFCNLQIMGWIGISDAQIVGSKLPNQSDQTFGPCGYLDFKYLPFVFTI